jgi:hypothetical protein
MAKHQKAAVPSSPPVAAKVPEFDRVFDRLSGRNWVQIRELWTPLLPITLPLASPTNTALGACTSAQVSEQIQVTGEHREANVPNLREAVFSEGLLLLARSLYLLRSAIGQASNGYPSWSFVTSYHSSLTSCQAILRFLGIEMLEISDKWLLIDVWPGPPKGKVQQSKGKYLRNSQIQFVRCRRVEQRHWWQLLREVLEHTEISIWDSALTDSLIDLPETAFAHQRNFLIYRLDPWPFSDLIDPTPVTLLSRLYPAGLSSIDLTVSSPHFTHMLSIVLVKFAMTMLRDISGQTPAFQSVVNELDKLANHVDAEVMRRLWH